ncbi:MAG: Clp protease ClpP [Clostridiales bacterium]|nr:Clp protease ClpP [Clostridiales bacterium]
MATKTKTPATKTPAPYFYIEDDDETKVSDVYIFGNIAGERSGLGRLLSDPSERSSYSLVRELQNIPDDYAVTVHINSNGGDLKEGLGIYNTLKSRENVTTICEGFAASAGSVVFAAGSRRVMQPASLLFIHQASFMSVDGNADDFAKYADDLRTITETAVNAYLESGVNISREELDNMLRAETWIKPEDALRMGFATEIAADDEEEPEEGNPGVAVSNDAMRSIMAAVTEPKHEPKELGVFNVDIHGINELEELVNNLDGKLAGAYPQLVALANRAEKALAENPGLADQLVKAVNLFTVTPAPKSPARDGHRGFFNFNKAGETGKEV